MGDKCEAVSSVDGHYHRATVASVNTLMHTITVRFDDSSETEPSEVAMDYVRAVGSSAAHIPKVPDSKRLVKGPSADSVAAAKLAKRAKSTKKKEKAAAAEKVREQVKDKWQQFNKKSSKGKKSIFATPEGASGRVGVGTCGIGGRMTETDERNVSWRNSLPKGE